MKIEELKAAAEAATPGPWWSGKCEPADGHALAWIGNHFVDCEGGQRNYKDQEDDARFIAQANPVTILKLIAVVEAAKELLTHKTIDWHDRQPLIDALKEMES